MLNEFKNYLILHTDSKRTIENYLERMKTFFKSYPKFNQENVNSYLTKLINENKNSATNLSLATFKKYALFKNIQMIFPKHRKITKKIKISLSRIEIEEEIFPYFEYLFKDYEKRKLIIRFMMLTMLRISEIVNLKKENINFENKQISILNGKGGKNRIVFLHESLIEDVKKMINQHNSPFVFNVNKGYIRYIFTQINKMLSYKKRITPHTLRHAGAKYLYTNGMPLKMLKEMLGHESLNTTDIYLDYSTEEIQKQFNKIKYKKGIKKNE